jgi:hypothetical protein
MFGCLRRLGCLAVIALAALGWFTREMWWDRAAGLFGGAPVAEADPAGQWEPVTQASAERGERAVRSLSAPRGPVFVSLRAGELASYAFLSLAPQLPPNAQDAQAAVVGDRMYVRSLVSIRDLVNSGALGSMGGMLAERDTLLLGGTFDVVRPGLAQLRVREIRYGAFPLPERMIPAIVRRVRQGDGAGEVEADALPIPLPPFIGDVRVARGKITLYRGQVAP